MTEFQKRAVALLLMTAFFGYTGYMYLFLPVPHPETSSLADEGKMIWQKHNCTACHQIYVLGGFLGPDLTNVFSVKGPDHIRAFLKIGNNTMPAYDLSEREVLALIAYLQHVDQSGVADPKTFSIQSNGTIRQQ